MRDSAPALRPAAVVGFILGFLVIRVFLFAVTTAGEFALYRDYAIQARDTSLAELHRARDIEYPPLATLFGVGVLYVADFLPEGVERLTVLRPMATLGVDHARYEVALGLVLFAIDVACLVLVHTIARRVYPDDSPVMHMARLWLYVAATTALGLIMYDRQDLVVGFVALLALAAFVRGWRLAAYAVLAAGVAYKLVPLLLVPFWATAFAVLRSAPATPGASPGRSRASRSSPASSSRSCRPSCMFSAAASAPSSSSPSIRRAACNWNAPWPGRSCSRSLPRWWATGSAATPCTANCPIASRASPHR